MMTVASVLGLSHETQMAMSVNFEVDATPDEVSHGRFRVTSESDKWFPHPARVLARATEVLARHIVGVHRLSAIVIGSAEYRASWVSSVVLLEGRQEWGIDVSEDEYDALQAEYEYNVEVCFHAAFPAVQFTHTCGKLISMAPICRVSGNLTSDEYDRVTEYVDSLREAAWDMVCTASSGALYTHQGDWLREATIMEALGSFAAARTDGGEGIIEVDGVRCYVRRA